MSALAPYRVLDLTPSPFWLCGKMLADLGADVIKVERPGGDPGRANELRWAFQNRGKRSVVLAPGDPRFDDLVASADAVIDDGGERVYPDVVHTSITPFGLTGPRAHWKGPDIVLAAASGVMHMHGDPDRAPIRLSVPQYEMHGAAEAAAYTVIALYHGEPQRVDVSCQLAAIRTLMTAPGYPVLEDRDLHRTGGVNANGYPLVYPCADGYVTAMLAPAFGGRTFIATAAKQVDVPDWLRDFDWEGADFLEMARSERGREFWTAIADVLRRYFSTRTRQELYEHALAGGFLIAPVNSIADCRRDVQLAARDFWRSVDGVTHAGPWAKLSRTPLLDTAGAPRVGEHTDEVLNSSGRGVWGGSAERVPPIMIEPVWAEAVDPNPRADVFEGLHVLDMSWVGVGPMTARYLADHGATVIRLESSKRPDVLRALPPFPERKPGLNRSQFWADFNASKLGVGVDLTNPRGREVAMKLARLADVLLESFTPGTMRDWGMAYEHLEAVNPSLVMLSTCMQGQTGPHAHYRGFGQLIASLGGFYDLHGWPDRPPTPIGAYTDTVCQRFAATAVVAALDHRRRTGEGQHIDLSQYEAGMQFLGTELLDYEVNGRVATRAGNASPDADPHGAYPCAGEDRWVVIACETDEQRERLRAVTGDVDLATWTTERDPHEIAELLQPDVPAYPVLTLRELHADPQVVHRRYFVELDGHPEIGCAPYESVQAILSATPGRPRHRAPCLGEHTFEILRDRLGYSEEEIGDLIACEAVEITG